MTTGSIGPGTELAGRYRLEDLLTETEGARFWRATDTVLARSVAVHAVATDDPRAEALMEAARVSATVTDPHLLRVLDCDSGEEITWVVNEWGEGLSLDRMLERGTLPASRAAWLTREVADAIAAGHTQGVAHGRLSPESVLVTHAGAVKLIGYVVDASLETRTAPDPVYGDLDARESDVINLAGILYAALTGRWPGVAPSAVPSAPREGKRLLRPRQVRAGVPRTLDAICDRVLLKEASQHAMPIETAQEIAAALADFVGDPGLTAPMTPAHLFDEPTVSIRRDELPTGEDLVAATTAAFRAPEPPAAASEPEPEPEPAPEPEPTPEPEPEPTPEPEPSAPEPDLESTQMYAASDGTGSLDPMRAPSSGPTSAPSSGAPTPPPPFEDIAERPLFASTERRVPAAAAASAAAAAESRAQAAARSGATDPDGSASDTSGGSSWDTTHGGVSADPSSPAFWPFTGDDAAAEVHTGREGRGWLRMAIIAAVVLAVVFGTILAVNLGRGGGTLPFTGPDPTPEATPSSVVLKIAGAKDFDPESDTGEENPDEVGRAIDGDKASAWRTLTYRGNPALGGLKSGVGLFVDLGKDQKPASLTVRFNGAPTSFEVYAAAAGVTSYPTQLDQLDKVGSAIADGDRATVKLDPVPTTRYLLIWLTRLPPVSGGYRGEIADVTVRS